MNIQVILVLGDSFGRPTVHKCLLHYHVQRLRMCKSLSFRSMDHRAGMAAQQRSSTDPTFVKAGSIRFIIARVDTEWEKPMKIRSLSQECHTRLNIEERPTGDFSVQWREPVEISR